CRASASTGTAAVRGSTRAQRPFRRSPVAGARASTRSLTGARSGHDETCRSRSCGSAASMVRDINPGCGSLAGRCAPPPRPVHAQDSAEAIDAAFARRADGVFNIVDDEPASPSEQIAFAAHLIGIDPPPEIPYAEPGKSVSPMALSFYDGCIRARNDKLKAVLGVRLRYPTYRDGLRALHAAGDHLAVAKPAAPA